MRVLVTTDCVGGVWTYSLELARELTARGNEVVLAVMGADLTTDQQAELAALGVHAWESRPYRLEWMASPEQDLIEAGEWLLQVAHRHRPDVVHLNQFSHATLAWETPVIVVAHSDVITWWRAVHGQDPGVEWSAYRSRVSAGLAAADLVVAPTAAYLDQLRSAYDFTTPADVVHNGRRLQIPPGEQLPQLVAAGRLWDRAKNVAAAARAADGLPWPLIVAGPAGEQQPQGETVRYVGRLPGDQLLALFANASVFVAPARYEPFGLAALEAATAGCALVLGDVPTLREVWGPAATYVAPDDEAGLRHALQQLIAQPELLRERQRQAANRAGRYSTSAMATAYAAHYADLISGHADRVAS